MIFIFLYECILNPISYFYFHSLQGGAAHHLFKQYDVQGDGRLSVDELTKCCACLVPGISKRDVASLMVWMDQGKEGDGYLGYKHFIKNLVGGGQDKNT